MSQVVAELRTRAVGRRPVAIDAAIVSSAAAALAHLIAAPGHYTWWPAAGVFFVALGVAQLAYAALLFLRVVTPRSALLGIWTTVGVILVYVASRTIGIPGAPPVPFHGGRWIITKSAIPNGAKHVGPLDIFTLIAELLLVVLMVSTLPSKMKSRTVDALMWIGLLLLGAGVVGLV